MKRYLVAEREAKCRLRHAIAMSLACGILLMVTNIIVGVQESSQGGESSS